MPHFSHFHQVSLLKISKGKEILLNNYFSKVISPHSLLPTLRSSNRAASSWRTGERESKASRVMARHYHTIQREVLRRFVLIPNLIRSQEVAPLKNLHRGGRGGSCGRTTPLSSDDNCATLMGAPCKGTRSSSGYCFLAARERNMFLFLINWGKRVLRREYLFVFFVLLWEYIV